MTIAAVCLTTCFIVMKHEPFIHHKVNSMQHKMDQDIEVRVQTLRTFQKTIKWKYEQDLRSYLEKAVTETVNPTLVTIQSKINNGTYGEDAKTCYNKLEHKMLNVTEDYYIRMMVPCIYQFRTYIINSLFGIPQLLDTFDDLRRRLGEIIANCDGHPYCVKVEETNMEIETLKLLAVAKAYTDNAAHLYLLAISRFAKCMKYAGMQLEKATVDVTKNGTRCLQS